MFAAVSCATAVAARSRTLASVGHSIRRTFPLPSVRSSNNIVVAVRVPRYPPRVLDTALSAANSVSLSVTCCLISPSSTVHSAPPVSPSFTRSPFTPPSRPSTPSFTALNMSSIDLVVPLECVVAAVGDICPFTVFIPPCVVNIADACGIARSAHDIHAVGCPSTGGWGSILAAIAVTRTRFICITTVSSNSLPSPRVASCTSCSMFCHCSRVCASASVSGPPESVCVIPRVGLCCILFLVSCTAVVSASMYFWVAPSTFPFCMFICLSPCAASISVRISRPAARSLSAIPVLPGSPAVPPIVFLNSSALASDGRHVCTPLPNSRRCCAATCPSSSVLAVVGIPPGSQAISGVCVIDSGPGLRPTPSRVLLPSPHCIMLGLAWM